MGVSGCGKSTIGKRLAKELDLPFFDGDDYHPIENVQKMAAGKPLNDQDRKGWLEILNDLAYRQKDTGAVIACSALKKAYRKLLVDRLKEKAIFIYLEGSFEQITNRLMARKNHFMPAHLLKSQFETLETPSNALTISITKSPEQMVLQITNELKSM